jgi:hypothetical protein
MFMKPLHCAVLSILMLLPVGCATFQPAPGHLPPLADPAGYTQAALRVGHSASLSGIARITIKVGNSSQGYKTVFASRYPDGLRLEILGLFNQPGLYISANRETGITLYSPTQNAWYRGPATADSMQRISGILMDPLAIVRTIHGSPPGPDPEQSRISCTQDNGMYQCRLEEGRVAQDIWIDPPTGTIVRSRLYENALGVHDIRYQDFLRLDEGSIPGKILVTFDRYAASLEIKLSNPLSTPLETGQLRLQAPEGTVFLPLTAFFEER